MATTIDDALRALYSREINVSIATFWDAGCTVKVGDGWNGYSAVREFTREEFGQIGDWLLAHADDPAQQPIVPPPLLYLETALPKEPGAVFALGDG